ncbi:MAG: hypothetical protein H6799_00105 [Candidatus Nomurabacteria bacterium]|nr:MAG: hypothetical protein H6799_00105 [Candidatus Nomurabacteria bacterium]HRV76032.1 hypothetical protein [Candidatus Saccharimonadales bacterium]
MKFIGDLYNDVSIGSKLYLSNAGDSLISHKNRLIKGRNALLCAVAALGLGSSAVGLGNLMEGQTNSEIADISAEASLTINGFDHVSSARHAELGRPPTATIVLDNGDTCFVRYSQNTKGLLNMPWGADVTDWRDCPLIEDQD